jgi:hypothetical protein
VRGSDGVVAEAVLLPGDGSGVGEDTVAVLVATDVDPTL